MCLELQLKLRQEVFLVLLVSVLPIEESAMLYSPDVLRDVSEKSLHVKRAWQGKIKAECSAVECGEKKEEEWDESIGEHEI